MLIWKEAIRPGIYWYDDPVSGLPRKLDVPPEMIAYWHSTGKEMLAAGLSIPVPVEHQATAKPLTPAERAAANLLNNAGWVKDYKTEKITDEETGLVTDALFAHVEVEDESIIGKLPKTIRWTSPWISSFTDGNGKPWQGVISHLALTTRPRITKQQPFPSISAAMSYAAGSTPLQTLDLSHVPQKGLSLSRAGLLLALHQGEGARLRPAYPIAFSLLTGATLAVDDLKPKATKKSADSPDSPPVGKPADPAAPPEAGLAPDKPLVDGDGDISVYDVLCDLLAAVGITLPDGTDANNFAQNLYRAAMDQVKGKGSGDPMKPPDISKPQAPNSTPASTPVVEDQPPMYMSIMLSQEEVNKITDPGLRRIASISLSLQQNALEAAKAKRAERIEKLLKKVRSEAFKKQLLEQATSAKLSLAPDGKVVDSLDAMLDLLDSGIRDLPALLTTDAAALSEVEHPREYDGQMSEARRAEVAAELAKNMGLAAAAKAG